MVDSPPPTAVIFDLDGTLVQARLASWQVFRTVNDRFDLGISGPEQFFALFDGNLYASLRRLCRDDAHAAAVKKAFLEELGQAYAPALIPGMTDVVRRLASVATLAVVSSNSMAVIRRILTDHDLALCFSHVFGGDVSESKKRTIEAFLDDATTGFGRRCEGGYDEGASPQRHDPRNTVLVTDTAGDVIEAREAGIRVVGVAWGMHSEDELTRAGAEFVAVWPQEILSHLLGAAASRPAVGACALPTRGACDGACPGGCAGRSCDGCALSSTRETTPAPSRADEAAAIRRRRRVEQALAARGRTPAAGSPRPGREQPRRPPTAQTELRDAVGVICG